MGNWEKPVSDLFRSLLGRTDEQLMWRVKTEGDQEAFAGLVGRWQKPIHALCTRMTGDRDLAEDLTQTAFTRLFASRQRWEGASKFSTYLWRVAINLCHDEARKSWRRNECSLDLVEDEESGELQVHAASDLPPDAQAEARERNEIVREALLKLDPRYREVVVLKHYEGLRFHEIATVLGIPEGTVKSRMAEGLNRLNKLLKGLDSSCNQTRKQTELRAP
jgi:RNA polymerase sigma-70 factor (ECF subfamily)